MDGTMNVNFKDNICDQGSVHNYQYVTETVCGIIIDDRQSTENSL